MTLRWALYDFVDSRRNNAIKIWTESLQKKERLKINTRIAMLGDNGGNLSPRVFSDSKEPHIKKIRVQGHVAPRLFFCRGPIEVKTEFTLLLGTTEKDNKTVDRNAAEKAEARRKVVLDDPARRRCVHEEVRP